ncbi:hypothetical protein K4F52_002320 [Lecanicillium sp. MT-2017a]|nr:hypothetical protein K4F52_002320 [Lecanicillium sp. MT-2017a]
MDQNLTILIHPRTRASKSNPKPDPFRKDINTAFTSYVVSLASRVHPPQPPGSPTAPTPAGRLLIHLPPPAQMLPSGCWCSDSSRPSPHTWKTCPRWIPQAIVESGAQPTPCTHSSSPQLPPEHLFCFDPTQAATDYITWFTHIPGPPETPLARFDEEYLGEWLREQYYACARGEDEEPGGETEARADLELLSRVFVELRGEPPGPKRLGGWYDAERVHALLGWADMEARECMEVFLPWVRYAKMQRLQGG